MRAPASALALVLVAALLAGCGLTSFLWPQSNGEAAKPPGRVLADATAAAAAASSAHVSGSIASSGTRIVLDLATVRGKGARGSLSTNGLRLDLVRLGGTAYLRGSDGFLRHFAGPAIAQLVHGSWLKTSIDTPRFASLRPLTDVGLLLGKVSSHHGKLVNEGTTTYNGTEVVAIRDTSDNSRLYVAATGMPYPVAIVGGKKSQSGTIVLGDWNAPVSLSTPSGAIPIGQLGG